MDKVSLRFACPENKNTMNHCGGENYHCGSCDRVVRDFTNVHDLSEIKKDLQNGKKTCGIFNRSQVNTSLLKYAAGAVIISSMASCKDESIKPDIISTDISTEILEAPLTGDIETIGLLINIETFPEPVMGYEKMYELLQSRISFPEGLTRRQKVFVELLIDEAGNIKSFEILKGISGETDAAIKRQLEQINIAFHPGTMDGVPAEMRMIIPIVFEGPVIE